MSKAIYIEDYSTKSFVVRGETREYKEDIKALGGKWNSRLTDKSTGDKFGAWLFWSDKRADIKNWLDGECKSVSSSSSSIPESKSVKISKQEMDRLDSLELKIDRLTTMLISLCKNTNTPLPVIHEDTKPKKPISVSPKKLPVSRPRLSREISTSIEDVDVEVDESTPHKRLLG